MKKLEKFRNIIDPFLDVEGFFIINKIIIPMLYLHKKKPEQCSGLLSSGDRIRTDDLWVTYYCFGISSNTHAIHISDSVKIRYAPLTFLFFPFPLINGLPWQELFLIPVQHPWG